MELVGIDNGVVQLRLVGNCHGCPSLTATVKARVEQAIYETAPETVRIEVDGSLEPLAAADTRAFRVVGATGGEVDSRWAEA